MKSGLHFQYSSRRNRKFYQEISGFESTFIDSTYASFEGGFTIDRLQQTPLRRVLETKPTNNFGTIQSCYADLAETLKFCYAPVGMIQYGHSEYLGTCVLISDDCVLLPRHVFEGAGDIRSFSARFKYLSANQKGTSVRFFRIIEESEVRDYVIAQLAGFPGIRCMPLSFSTNTHLALLHHPIGKPLTVSVHAVSQNPHRIRMLTNHDTDFGSSGGAYIAADGTMVAMHLGCELEKLAQGGNNVTRYAIRIEEIVEMNKHGVLSKIINRSFNIADYCDKRKTSLSYPHVQRTYFEVEMKEKRKKYLEQQEFKRKTLEAAQRSEIRASRYSTSNYELMTVRDLAAHFSKLGMNIFQNVFHTETNKTIFYNNNTGWYVCLDKQQNYNTVIDGNLYVALDGTKSYDGRHAKFHFKNENARVSLSANVRL